MALRVALPKRTVAGGAASVFPASGQFISTIDVDALTIVLAVGATTARGITIELADNEGNVYAVLTPATIPAGTNGAYTIAPGALTVGTNFIAVPVVIPHKIRINLLAAGANSVDVSIYGRGND